MAGAVGARYVRRMRPVVIVGGGLLGCSVAWELGKRGRRTIVLERAVVGAEASTAAAGILAPRMEAHGDTGFRALGIASLEMYARWVEPLGDVGFRRCGVVSVLPEQPDPDAIRRDSASLVRIQQGLSVDEAWWLPEEATVDTRRLVHAVHAASEAEFIVGREVRAVDARGVTLAGGERVDGTVVVCAGAWTSLVPGMASIPVHPVRGQLVALDARIQAIVFGEGGYLVPRRDEVVCGATVEEVGFSRGVTDAGVAEVLASARRMLPTLGSATTLRSWSGFRPGSPDRQPIVGSVGDIWVASGHYRNGVLLAPLTARRLAEAVCDGAPLPTEWDPARFAATRPESSAS